MKDHLNFAALRALLQMRQSEGIVDDYLLVKSLETSEQEEQDLRLLRSTLGCGSVLLLVLGGIVCVSLRLLL